MIVADVWQDATEPGNTGERDRLLGLVDSLSKRLGSGDSGASARISYDGDSVVPSISFNE